MFIIKSKDSSSRHLKFTKSCFLTKYENIVDLFKNHSIIIRNLKFKKTKRCSWRRIIIFYKLKGMYKLVMQIIKTKKYHLVQKSTEWIENWGSRSKRQAKYAL